jgi:hypothetical protein
MRASSMNMAVGFTTNFAGGDTVKKPTTEDSVLLGCGILLMGVWFMTF